MTWKVEYLPQAVQDLEKLDNSQRIFVLKGIEKVKQNPLPDFEGGYGKPLGNHKNSRLAGYLKIKLKKLGLRIVYRIVKQNRVMKIIIISIRDDEAVYKMAESRIKDST